MPSYASWVAPNKTQGNGTWKQGTVYVKQNGSWVEVSDVLVKDNGTWK